MMPANGGRLIKNGSDRVRMLRRTMEGEIDAWDIRLCYSQFKYHGVTAYPTLSKVENIGFYTSDGVNTNVYNRYKTRLDHTAILTFSLPDRIEENPY